MSATICLHVDDVFCVGDKEFYDLLTQAITRVCLNGSEDTNGIMCVGQCGRCMEDNGDMFASRWIKRGLLKNSEKSNLTSN